jgi:hypothetical protein
VLHASLVMMRALTIYQPWASLIIAGVKPYEFRDHDRWVRRHVGERVVIHAGLALIKSERWRETRRYPELTTAPGDPERARALLARPLRSFLRGVGLGTVEIGEPVRCTRLPELVAIAEQLGFEISPSKWAWPLLDPRPFDVPVPCRGGRGFWSWPLGSAG